MNQAALKAFQGMLVTTILAVYSGQVVIGGVVL